MTQTTAKIMEPPVAETPAVRAFDTPPIRADLRHAMQPVTLWGRDCLALHDWIWACRGVRIVRRGRPAVQKVTARCLLLLLEPDQLVLFDLPPATRKLQRLTPLALRVVLQSTAVTRVSESLRTTDDGLLHAVQRQYTPPVTGTSAVYLTNDWHAAESWRKALDAAAAERSLRAALPFGRFRDASAAGRAMQSDLNRTDSHIQQLLQAHTLQLENSDSDLVHIRPNAWAHRTAIVPDSVRCIGTVWIGAGVEIPPGSIIVGPHVFHDVIPGTQSPLQHVCHETSILRRQRYRDLSTRRLFDIAFSLIVLTLTLPIWPILALLIWADDGLPILYRHRRQTLGGREFNCLKFRTMRTDADEVKAQLQDDNICDGPQFHIENDPRETRIGRVLRRFHLDELPQFLNVLSGDMSVVGPRPSPESENQFCPAWRTTRLSIKPGITGLWQIRRTRQPLTDFQEWIRYDTEYVRRRTWWGDLRIIAATVRRMIPV